MALDYKQVSPEKRTGFTFKGKEIVLCKTRGRVVGSTGIQKREGWYPDEKRIEVATLYAVTGNKKTVESLTGVPASAIGRWIREDWFRALLDNIRAENDHLIDAKQTEIIHLAMDQLKDRLVDGDHVILRDGSTVRKPVGAKDLSLVQAINLDKRQLLRGKPTSRTEQVQSKSVDDKLSELAESFKKVANRQPTKELEVIDVEILEERSNA